jgi:enoyl-CoA hydratase/carnithine racemase
MTALVEFNERPDYCLITMDDTKANALSFSIMEQVNAALDSALQREFAS